MLMNLIMLSIKKIIKLLFNRIFYVVLALCIQLFWIFLTVWRLIGYFRFISIAMSVISVIVVLYIVNRRINPSYKLAWTILIFTVPIFGLVLYFLFGSSRIASTMEEKYQCIMEECREYLHEEETSSQRLKEMDIYAYNQSQYIFHMSGFPAHENTKAEYFQVGDDMFPVLIRELEKAEHYIYIEYFIINDGIMWRTILDILERKAKQGVDVRLIYDDFGCLTTLPYNYRKYLIQHGIKCEVFNKFRPLLNVIQNNRDHRKLCIIDGWTGFTGGINLSDEYINQKERFGHWKDTAIMLKGDAVWNMTAMFLHMWGMVTHSEEQIVFEEYLPHANHQEPFEGDGYVQPFCDSPLDDEILGENIYLNIINKAKKYVYICTPYLIIDNEMMTALCLAAKSGIDVRIMTPGVPDKKIVFLLTQSYYERLLEAGVRIYEYQPGFLHAKSFVCDDEIAVIGTINLDYRSLYLHFEDGVWMYKNKMVSDVYQDFVETLEYCEEKTIDFCRNRHVMIRLLQHILRIFAPML